MVKIIADLCQNHKGDINRIKEMVWKAAEAGATFAKVQSMLADDLTFRERFELGEIEDGKNVVIKRPYKPEYERLKPMDLTDEMHFKFIDECKTAGIKPLTAVFSRSRIPFLASLIWPESHIKVPSYDCASFPMIKELKDRFNHLYISTGATFDDEIKKTAEILKSHNFSFLHCVTIYPTPLDKLNLSRMEWLRQFTPEVGFSDHTLIERDGIKADIVAIYLGADIIERHFTILDRTLTKDGPVSINPDELKMIVQFANMSKSDLGDYVEKNIPEWKQMAGVELPGLSHEELLNRDYYRGRFASKVNGKIIYNWEDEIVF